MERAEARVAVGHIGDEEAGTVALRAAWRRSRRLRALLVIRLRRWRDHEGRHPLPHLEQIAAPLLAINFADDLVNPPELAVLEREIRRLPRGEAVVIPANAATHGHRGHSWPILWREHLARLLDRLPPLSPG